MSDRETLEAALDFWQRPENSRELEPDELLICAAARRNLNLQPETCGTCGGTGEPTQIVDFHGVVHEACPSCHGRGTVYPAELVEVVAKTIYDGDMGSVEIIVDGIVAPPDEWDSLDTGMKDIYRPMAVAVLDAINSYAADQPGREECLRTSGNG